MTRQVRDAYDRWAATYDQMENPTRDLDAELLRADLSTWTLGDILEVGCGTGTSLWGRAWPSVLTWAK